MSFYLYAVAVFSAALVMNFIDVKLGEKRPSLRAVLRYWIVASYILGVVFIWAASKP